jgi:serine/threonine protein kinase
MVGEELKVLQALKHPNIIYLHEIINDPNKTNEDIYLVTEYHSNGSIGDQLKNINKLFKENNEKCLEEGKLNEITTKGLPI